MKYLWILVVLGATSAFGQNAYGPDFLNLHCTVPDLNSVPTFGVAPKPGFAPNGSTNGSATIYCDGPSGTLKVSFNNNPFITLGGTNATYFGTCGSTAPSAGTFTVANLGLSQSGAGTCAGTINPTTNLIGTPISHNCTLKNFTIYSSAAGVNASDGVGTIYLAHTATSLTCTIGTGTTCQDTTHTVSATAGQQLSVGIVSQASSTLANVGVSVDCQ